MTQKMMIKAGAKISINTEDANNIHISVDNKPYEECHLEAEVDWSSAAFWYQIVSLSKIRNLILKGLNKNSIQGDIKLIEFFKQLGVSTSFTNKGVLISYTGDIRREPKFDFTDYPDLALPVVITAAAHGVRGIFTGLSSLQHKESNRLKVLEETVSVLSGIRTISHCGKLALPKRAIGERLTIKANDDHRVIMALTPLSLLGIDVKLEKENMKEVNKSYPNFWSELGRVFHLH